MFKYQTHLLSEQMKRSLLLVASKYPSDSSWIFELLQMKNIGEQFCVSRDQALRLCRNADEIIQHNLVIDSQVTIELSKFDSNNYFLLQSGICSPSY